MTDGNWDIWLSYLLGFVEIHVVLPVAELIARASQEKKNTSHTYM